DPMHRERVDHHEHHSNQRREHHVHRERNEFLYIAANFLELAEGLATSLILEYRVRQLERVTNSVRVHLRAKPLNDDVDEIVLKVFRDAGDERDAHSKKKKERNTAHELPCCVLLELCRVRVDDVTKN